MRFLPAVAALADGPVRLDGDAEARVRPMSPVIDALRVLGVELEDSDGFLPRRSSAAAASPAGR